jgi:hypothetical protein
LFLVYSCSQRAINQDASILTYGIGSPEKLKNKERHWPERILPADHSGIVFRLILKRTIIKGEMELNRKLTY